MTTPNIWTQKSLERQKAIENKQVNGEISKKPKDGKRVELSSAEGGQAITGAKPRPSQQLSAPAAEKTDLKNLKENKLPEKEEKNPVSALKPTSKLVQANVSFREAARLAPSSSIVQNQASSVKVIIALKRFIVTFLPF